MGRVRCVLIVAMCLASAGCHRPKIRSTAGSTVAGPGPTFSGGSAPSQAEPPEPARILRVNDQIITIEDVLEPLMPTMSREAAGLAGVQQRRYVMERIQTELVTRIQDGLLYQEASKNITDQMMKVLDHYVDEELRDRVNREFGGREARFEGHLAAAGLTIDDARDEVRRRIIIVKFLQDTIVPRVSDPTRRELLDYYQANVGSYTEPAVRELYLIDIPKGAESQAARSAVERALLRLAAGEEFGQVAREFSAGIHAADGGSWGRIKSPLQGRYAEPSAVFFELEQGQISDIVETDDAYFIVKAGAVIESHTRAFDQVQPDLVERYRDGQFDILRAELARDLVAKAVIEPDEDLFLTSLVDTAVDRLSRAGRP